MVFIEENSFYRRFTRVWYVLGVASAFGVAYNNFASRSTASTTDSIFKYCTYANVFFLLAWAISFGLNVWVSFVAGPVMYMKMNRHAFADIQNHLFPIYFVIQGVAAFLQLGIFLFVKNTVSNLPRGDLFVLGAIGVGLVNGFLNSVLISPKLHQVGSKRIALEREEGVVAPNIGPKLKENPTYRGLCKQFGMYHGISTLLNLFSLAGNVYVLYFLSRELMMAGRIV